MILHSFVKLVLKLIDTSESPFLISCLNILGLLQIKAICSCPSQWSWRTIDCSYNYETLLCVRRQLPCSQDKQTVIFTSAIYLLFVPEFSLSMSELSWKSD